MQTNRSFLGIACRLAAFSFLMAGAASLAHAQQVPSVASTFKTPIFLASEAAPADASSSSSSSSSSSADDALAAGPGAAAFAGSQPPPRRRYGRPNYSDSHNNPDGSEKWTFLAGAGLGLPVGDTHRYETEGYGFQVGGGRNFNKTVGVMLQFDYDHFGLQGTTIANQSYVYSYCTAAEFKAGLCTPQGPGAGVPQLDANNHVWSFTLDPTFTLATEGSLGAYAVVGGGFYHKVTNFTLPSSECLDVYCFYQITVNQNVDHYTSNAGGVNAGFGLTYKFSQFSNERFYVEARYVLMVNQQRYGVTAQNVASSSITATDFYPANSNRTTYIPIKFGLRF